MLEQAAEAAIEKSPKATVQKIRIIHGTKEVYIPASLLTPITQKDGQLEEGVNPDAVGSGKSLSPHASFRVVANETKRPEDLAAKAKAKFAGVRKIYQSRGSKDSKDGDPPVNALGYNGKEKIRSSSPTGSFKQKQLQSKRTTISRTKLDVEKPD